MRIFVMMSSPCARLVGLFFSLVWAQTAGVWYWHHHSSAGTAYPTEGWIGSGGQPFRAIPGKVVVVGDTVYVLGTAAHPSSNDKLLLPNSSVELESPNGSSVSAYVAAYSRTDGAFLWVLHLRGQNGANTEVRGMDIAVSPAHEVYVLLNAFRPPGPSTDILIGRFRKEGWSSWSDLSFAYNSIERYRQSFIIGLSAVGTNPTILGVQRFGCEQGSPLDNCEGFEANFFSLLLHEGRLWASGTAVILQQGLSGRKLTIAHLTLALSAILGSLWNLSLPSFDDPAQAVLVRMRASDLMADSVAVVQSGSSLLNPPDCYGRALFAYGPDTVGWVVALRESGAKRYRVVGGTPTPVPSQPALRVILVRASTMGAHLSSLTSALANYANVSSNSAPPHYYVAFQRQGNSGGEIFWAAADTAYYFIQGQHYAQTSSPRLLISRAILNASGISGRNTLESQPLSQLQLSGIAIEPRTIGMGAPSPYIYLSGNLSGSALTLYRGPVSSNNLFVSLPGATLNNQPNSFVLGLQWMGSSWAYRGYKRIFSLSTQPAQHEVICGGLGRHPSLPQLYLYGWSRDSLLVEPRWADGSADTVRPSTDASFPPRLWIGRLDIYRLELDVGVSISPSSLCAPASMASLPQRITGTWDASTDRMLVWLPEIPTRRYQAKHSWAAIVANPLGAPTSFQEGSASGSFSLLLPGRMPPGRYFLALRSPVLGNRFADIGDTMWISISGTTVPNLQRAGALRWHRMVVRFAGGPNTLPAASEATQPFYRKERRFNQINSLVYHPWEGQAGGREYIYLLEWAGSNTYHLYRLDLATGFITPLRSWNAAISDPGYRGSSLLYDPVRQVLWSHGGGQTFWRLDSTDSAKDDTLTLYAAGASFAAGGVSSVGYPLRTSQLWMSNPTSFTWTQKGDLVGFVRHRTGLSAYRWVLVRVAPEQDSTFIVAGGGNDDCPTSNGSTLAGNTTSPGFSTITSDGDTLYWVQSVGSPCAAQPRLLWKAWPTDPQRRSYQVQVIDTLDPTNVSTYSAPTFSRVPERGLYLAATRGTNHFLLWYNLATKTRDTLLACLEGPCCEYDLSDYVQMNELPVPYVVLRSGAVVFRAASRELRIALPVLLPGQHDTLRAEATIQNVTYATSGSSYSQDTLYLASPPDSIRLELGTCFSTGKSFWYGKYPFPSGSIRIVAPDTVCEGMQFSSYVERADFPTEEGCPVGRRLTRVSSQMGYLQSLTFSGNEAQRWYAQTQGYDTLRMSLSRDRWAWLLSGFQNSFPIRIRRGHRLRMRVALEGPWISASGETKLMRAHPRLTRNLLAFYNENTNGVSPDSLWRLPRYAGDSLSKLWNLLLIEPSPTCLAPNGWMCASHWSQLARVEVYEAMTDQLVDSAYALVDTLGRLYLYRAPVGTIGLGMPLNADTLSFCYCDPTVPKYFVIRTPNHLPLYTQTISLPARGVGEADSIDLTDPSSLQGIPGIHYTLLADSTVSPPRMRAGAWTGNCADLYNSFVPGSHYDSGVVNAADWEFLMPRNGVTTGYSWADLDSDGDVDAVDALLLIQNQNELRQSSGP